MRLPLRLSVGADIDCMNTAIADLVFESSINQLLPLHRTKSIKNLTNCLDVVVITLSLDIELALRQVIF